MAGDDNIIKRLKETEGALESARARVAELERRLAFVGEQAASQPVDVTSGPEQPRILQNMLDAMPANIAVLAANGDILHVNASWRRFGEQNGLPSDTNYLAWNYLAVSDTAESLEARPAAVGIRAVIAGEQDSYDLEWNCHDLINNTERWFLMSVMPLDEAAPRRVIVAHTDITRRKQAEAEISKLNAALSQRVDERTEALNRTKNHVEAILNHSLDGITLLHTDLNIQQTNPAFNTLIGCKSDSCFGHSLLNIIHPDDRTPVEAALQSVINQQSGQRLEMRIIRRDGAVLQAEASIGYTYAHDRQEARLVCILRDITDRKKAEAALRHSEQQLRESQQMLQTVLDTIPVGVFWKDHNSVYLGCNRYYAQNAGLDSPAAIVGRRDTDMPWSRTKTDEYLARDRDILQHGITQVDFADKRITATGKVMWAATTKVPLRNPDGKAIGVLGAYMDITERKQAEQMLQTVLDTIPVGVFWKDHNSVYLGCNRQYALDAGLDSPAAVVGKRDYEMLWGDMHAASYVKSDQEILRHGIPMIFENSRLKADGSLMWVLATKAPLCNPDGDIAGILGVYMDITKRKQVEDQMRLYAAEIEDLYNRAPCGYHSVDSKSTITRINDTELEWLGYTREEVVGKLRFVDMISPEGKKTFAEKFPVFKERGWMHDVEFVMIRKDGTPMNVLLNATAIYDEQGCFAASRSTIFDVTEHNRVRDALRESEVRYRLLAENITDMVARLDLSFKYVYVSPSCYFLLGYTPAEMEGKSRVDFIHPDDLPFVQDATNRALTEQHPHEPVAARFRHTDGHDVWMEVSGQSVFSAETGKAVEFVTISRDITLRKHYEETLERALAQERELGQLRSRFLSVASHEFRTPLALIMTSAEMISHYRDRIPETEIESRLEKIKEQVNHLKAILDDVLELEGLQQGRIRFNPVPSDLDALCREILEEFRTTPGQTNQLIYNGPAAPQFSRLDLRLMRQIFTNLLSNAIKYSLNDNPIWIDLGQVVDGSLILRVRDQGIGIPPEAMKNLFDAFHRAENVGSIPGHGLGLSIVKEAVELHGGTITVESVLNAGTTFTVTLPPDES